VVQATAVGEQAQSSSIEDDEQVELCPNCSSELILKISNKGKHKGKDFYGCSAFPKCRYILKIDE
jgi:restriction system protein